MASREFKKLMEAASRGDADAQRRLAEKLFKGEGTPRSPGEAFGWLWLSARRGDCQSEFLIDQLRRAGFLHSAGLE